MWRWCAAHDEGEALNLPVQKRRNRHAARKRLCELFNDHGVHPETIITDKLAS